MLHEASGNSPSNNEKGKLFLFKTFVAVPQLRRFFAGFPPRRLGFEPGSGHVDFEVLKSFLCKKVLKWLDGGRNLVAPQQDCVVDAAKLPTSVLLPVCSPVWAEVRGLCSIRQKPLLQLLIISVSFV
jgi:hypothetical protein